MTLEDAILIVTASEREQNDLPDLSARDAIRTVRDQLAIDGENCTCGYYRHHASSRKADADQLTHEC